MNKGQAEATEAAENQLDTMVRGNQDWLFRALVSERETMSLIMERQTMSVLKFIRDKSLQTDIPITKGQVIKYMDDKQICSRITTLKIIQRLLDHKVLINERKRDNTASRLIISPSFNFGELETDVLTTCIKEIRQHFNDFNDDSTKAVNTILVDNLLATLQSFSSKKKDKQQQQQQEVHAATPTPTPKQRRK